MKKLLIAIAMLLVAKGVHAQPSFTVLQQLDTVYEDVKVFSSAYIAGLRNHATSTYIDLRSNTGNNFGTLASQIPIGDPNSFFTHLEPVGNHIYACGFYLQAINLSNVAAPVNGPIQYFGYMSGVGHNNNMLYIMTETFSNNVIKAFSLFNPMFPQQVDSLVLPKNGSFSIGQNRLFYAHSDSALGNRVFSYSLSNTAPYFTTNPIFTLAGSAPYDVPSTDVTGNHLIVKTQDTLYDLVIGTGGNLQMGRKQRTSASNAFKIVAHDTATICYAGYQRVDAQSLSNGALKLVDTTDRMSFNSVRQINKLGHNVYYATLMKMTLIRFGAVPSVINSFGQKDDRFTIYPNPTKDQWSVESTADATFSLYAADGKLVQTRSLSAQNKHVINAQQFPDGLYFYRITAKEGKVSSGRLIKKAE